MRSCDLRTNERSKKNAREGDIYIQREKLQLLDRISLVGQFGKKWCNNFYNALGVECTLYLVRPYREYIFRVSLLLQQKIVC